MPNVVVDILVPEGAMPSSVAITFDIFETANQLALRSGKSFRFDVAGVSVDRSSNARLGHRQFSVGKLSGMRAKADLLVLPGLGFTSAVAIDAYLSTPTAQTIAGILSKAAARGAQIASSCSGVFLLAEAGLLHGRTVTTSWWLASAFRQRYPTIALDMEQLVIADGPILTAGAAMAQFDLILMIIGYLGDVRIADLCAKYLLLDQRHGQSRYMALSYLAAQEPRLKKSEAWILANLSRQFSVSELAAVTGMTERTFARHVRRHTGLTPIEFVQRTRLDSAVALLETTNLPIEEIARQVGYTDPSALRRVMRRTLDRRPGELRLPRGKSLAHGRASWAKEYRGLRPTKN